MGVPWFAEYDLPDQTKDNGQDGVEKNVCTRGASETTCKIKSYGRNDNEEETIERKKRIRSLIELKSAEQGGEGDCIQEWDSFGIGDAHSTSFVHDCGTKRYWLPGEPVALLLDDLDQVVMGT
jgi:hypothetical protein